MLPTAIVGSNSNRRASVACEQAFGRAGNWGEGKAFPFAIFSAKKTESLFTGYASVTRRVTYDHGSLLIGYYYEGVKISRERVDSKGLYGR